MLLTSWGFGKIRDAVVLLAVSFASCAGCSRVLPVCDSPFPRLHPVPTQPVFSPPMADSAPAMMEMQVLNGDGNAAPPATAAPDFKRPVSTQDQQTENEPLRTRATPHTEPAPLPNGGASPLPGSAPSHTPSKPSAASPRHERERVFSGQSWIFRPALVSPVETHVEAVKQSKADRPDVLR